MPAQPLIASLPLDLVMASGYVIRLTALNPSTGATITGVVVSDVTFQVRPVNIGPDGTTDGAAPLPLLVPASDVVEAPAPPPTPAPVPSNSVLSGALHTQAAAVTDLPVKTFDLAVADKLEPTATPTVTLPTGARPFHTLANAITDVAIHLWAVAVADRLEA
jgi:hypothetical protein